MKKDIGYFIDIERFIRWTYDNKELFGDKPENIASMSILKDWRNYKKFPNDGSIKRINAKQKNDEKIFEKIDVAELMICINNAKDHNRGKEAELTPISSTEKKVITMLLMGRILDWKSKEGYFTATREKHVDVYAYLSEFADKPNQKTVAYYYFPGRIVSFEQICELSNSFRNGITSDGIKDGLKALIQKRLIDRVSYKEKDLYKLSFEGCKEFLDKNK